jgi:hypothetical protein
MSPGPQRPFDAAVVIVSILRPTLLRAVRSVFAQDFPGRVQVLVGVDKAAGERSMLDALRAECPVRMTLTVLDLGYSTAAANGGLYPNRFGGALPTILAYAADSPYVCHLDDDNWLAPDHLRRLRAAIAGFDWAFTLRWFVDPATAAPLGIDTWESAGPGRGVFKARFGGFVDTNCFMIDKRRCHMVLPLWSLAIAPEGHGQDRLVLDALMRRHPVGWTGAPTVYYVLDPTDVNHADRLRRLAERKLPACFFP